MRRKRGGGRRGEGEGGERGERKEMSEMVKGEERGNTKVRGIKKEGKGGGREREKKEEEEMKKKKKNEEKQKGGGEKEEGRKGRRKLLLLPLPLHLLPLSSSKEDSTYHAWGEKPVRWGRRGNVDRPH